MCQSSSFCRYVPMFWSYCTLMFEVTTSEKQNHFLCSMSASLPVYILTHKLQFDTHTALMNVHCNAGCSGVRRHEELTRCDGLFPE